MKIAVYCSSAEGLAPQLYQKSRAFGQSMAQRGHTLVYGGYDKGIMGEVARGVHTEGGEIVAVIPHIFDCQGFHYAGCTRIIHAESMRERKAIMEEVCDAMVLLPGGIGTLDELFDAFVLKTLGQLNRPILIWNLDGCYAMLERLLDEMVQNGFLSEKNRFAVEFFEDGEKLLNALDGDIKGR